MKNIIIFGSGEFGKNIFNIYKNKYNILYFCDNDISKYNKIIFNTKVILPLELEKFDYDKIVIASTYAKEIYDQLVNDLNISKSKIKKLYVNESNIQFYSKEKREKSEYFMSFIANLLKKNAIDYYLDHGTLLGIIRDNSLIPWDKDIDFAVLAQDEKKICKLLDDTLPSYIHPDCLENNWKYKIAREELILNHKTIDAIVELQIYNDVTNINDLVGLDLMFRYKFENKLHWKVAGKHLSVNYNLCFPTKSIIFKDCLFEIPGNTNKYLENLFGNWKIPIKQWSYENYSNYENKMER